MIACVNLLGISRAYKKLLRQLFCLLCRHAHLLLQLAGKGIQFAEYGFLQGQLPL